MKASIDGIVVADAPESELIGIEAIGRRVPRLSPKCRMRRRRACRRGWGPLCLPTLSTHGYEVMRRDAIPEMSAVPGRVPVALGGRADAALEGPGD